MPTADNPSEVLPDDPYDKTAAAIRAGMDRFCEYLEPFKRAVEKTGDAKLRCELRSALVEMFTEALDMADAEATAELHHLVVIYCEECGVAAAVGECAYCGFPVCSVCFEGLHGG